MKENKQEIYYDIAKIVGSLALAPLIFLFCLIICLFLMDIWKNLPDAVAGPLIYGTAILLAGMPTFLTVVSIYKRRHPISKKSFSPSSNSTSTSPISYTPTLLLNAIIQRDLDLVRTALADHPEQLNTAYAQNGNTPLHVAALNGYTEIVRLLLEQPGIDTTRTNNEGKTALDLAREKSFEEIVKLLENKQL